MTIYQIDSEIQSLIDAETGEILDMDALESLQMERSRKVENLACAVKNLSADAEAIRAEIRALTERAASADKKVEKAKSYLEFVLNGEPFESPRCQVKYRKSESVEIADEKEVYLFLSTGGYNSAFKYEPKINKAEVKKLLKSGVDVPQAKIVEKMNMGVK